MPEAISRVATHPAVRILRVAGAILFVISFACPVLPEKQFEGSYFQSAIFGYECARYAISFAIDDLKDRNPRALLLLMSDLINLLVPAYFVLTFFDRSKKFQTLLMYLTVACMVATWGWFLQAKAFPMYGHFAWITGALLIILPQWVQDRNFQQLVA